MLLPPICPLQCRPTVSSLTYLQTAKEYCPQGKRRNQHYPHHNPFSAPNPPLLSNAAKIPKFIIPLSPFLLPFPPGASSIRTRRRRKSRTNTCRRFFMRRYVAWKRVFFRRRRQMHEGEARRWPEVDLQIAAPSPPPPPPQGECLSTYAHDRRGSDPLNGGGGGGLREGCLLPAAQREDKIIGRREEKDFGGGGTS